MLTFAFISFIIVSVCVVLSMFKGFVIKNYSFELTTPDNTLLLGYLASTFGAYVTRRHSENKNDQVLVNMINRKPEESVTVIKGDKE